MMLDKMTALHLVPDPPYVLIIDDDPLFLATACEAVREQGLAARGVGSAVEGLEALAEGDAPKLILLDLILPGLGARDFLAVVKQEIALSRTPVVLVTAVAAEEVPGDLQVDGVVLKPVEASQLASLVHRYCGRA
jgi:CheY-like chemotaxis protein